MLFSELVSFFSLHYVAPVVTLVQVLKKILPRLDKSSKVGKNLSEEVLAPACYFLISPQKFLFGEFWSEFNHK